MTQKITEYLNLTHLRVKVICLHAWCEKTTMRNLVGLKSVVLRQLVLTGVSNHPITTIRGKQGNRVKVVNYPGLRANLFREVLLRLRNPGHGN